MHNCWMCKWQTMTRLRGYADKKFDFIGGSIEGTSHGIESDDLESVS